MNCDNVSIQQQTAGIAQTSEQGRDIGPDSNGREERRHACVRRLILGYVHAGDDRDGHVRFHAAGHRERQDAARL